MSQLIDRHPYIGADCSTLLLLNTDCVRPPPGFQSSLIRASRSIVTNLLLIQPPAESKVDTAIGTCVFDQNIVLRSTKGVSGTI